jgi:hypothetical protein
MSSYAILSLSIFLVEGNCLGLSKVTSTHVVTNLGKVIFAWALWWSSLGHLYDGWLGVICRWELLSWRKVLIVKWTVRGWSNEADTVSVVFLFSFREYQVREVVYR